MPTLALFFGISLAISFALKLNLNPIAYRAATVATGLSIGYVYSDFKRTLFIIYKNNKLITFLYYFFK